MTLATACTPRVVIVGNGSLGPYSLVDSNSVAIRFVSTSHVKLTRYSASTDDNNDGSVLVLNTDYTIGGTQDARTFTLIGSQAVLTSNQRIVAERVQSYTQDLDLTTGGAFNASSVESRFDKIAEFQQELKARLDRTVPLQFSDATANVGFPSPPTSATKFLARNTSGEFVYATAADLSADVALGTDWETILGLPAAGILDNLAGIRFVATYAALTALTTASGLSDNSIYCTYGRSAEEDGGFGFWRYDSGSSATADGGTILAIDGGGAGRFFRLYADEIHVEWFGAKGDNSTNDYTAIQAAVTCMNTKLQSYQPTLDVTGSYIQASSRIVFQPGKIYKIGTTVSLAQVAHIVAWGAIFKPHGAISGACFEAQASGGTYNGRYFTMEGGTFDGFERHVKIDNDNIGSGRIHFERTEFWDASTRSLELKCESSFITLNSPVFQQNVHSILLENGQAGGVAKCDIHNILLQQPRWTANGQNAIEVRGYYTNATDNAGDILRIYGGAFSGLDGSGGVGNSNTYTDLAWIKNNNGQAVHCYDVRFPREAGGVAAVTNYSAFRTADTAPPTEVVLVNCELSDTHSSTTDRVHGVRLHAVPNILTVTGCKTSHYYPTVEFGAGTTPSSLVSGGSRDLIKVNIKGNFSAFQTPTVPISDYIPAVLIPYDIWLKISFSAHKNGTDQTGVADATATKVTFGTANHNTGSLWSTADSKLTGLRGDVRISVTGAISGSLTSGAASYFMLYKNGSLHQYGLLQYSVGTSASGLFGSWTVTSTETDYWEIYVFIDNGSTTSTVTGTATLTHVCGEQV